MQVCNGLTLKLMLKFAITTPEEGYATESMGLKPVSLACLTFLDYTKCRALKMYKLDIITILRC